MDIIKNFEKFILENKRMYEYGCLMLDFDLPNWNSFLDKIKIEDLYKSENERYGLEDKPHITILYGFHDEVNAETIRECLGGEVNTPIKIKIDSIDIFENEEYDVVKLNVESSQLRKLNALCKKLPYTTDYPDYNPHMTIAYVKKGEGAKYRESVNLEFVIKPKFTLSMTSGDKVEI